MEVALLPVMVAEKQEEGGRPKKRFLKSEASSAVIRGQGKRVAGYVLLERSNETVGGEGEIAGFCKEICIGDGSGIG